ncbi:DDE-type integrase/transposase/recombinase [Stappia sp. TSB10P1A]|uniref:DDE-type integrase/transposase/recombinase n=1 Tax=Stappia sp. TSB10P1A TaxID=2003585 RepID=UPI001AD8CC81|nr:DDE-type integrase/transposase/recombinase [Stappia sp. TSB10P1A]
MNAQSPTQVQVWFTAAEIASLAAAGDMPGMPETKRGVNALADRESWHRYHALVRQRSGSEGSGYEYHLDLLPLDVRLGYLSRQIGPALALRDGDSPADLRGSGDLTDRARLTRDARVTILRLADRFRQMLDLGALGTDSLFADMYNAGRVPLPEWAAGVVRHVSARTLMRWRQARAIAGSAALGHDPAAARKGKGLLATAEGGRMRAYILAWILRNPALSAEMIRDYCEGEFGAEITDRHGEVKPLPPVRTFQHFIRELRAAEKVVITKNTNPDLYRSTMALRGTGAYRWVREPNQLWQIDASPVDALCTDGRHSMYACIDIATRRMVITLTKTPRASAVGLLIRKALLAWGVPKTVKTDNGSDFKARATVQLFDDLDIEVDVSAAYSPTEKAHVERVIKTFQHTFAVQLPGYVGHDVAKRKAIEERKAFSQRLGTDDAELFEVALSAAEVQAHVDEWLEVYYHARPHGGFKGALKGLTPAQAAATSTAPIARVDERALDVLLMPLAGRDGRRRMTGQGIRIDHLYYLSGRILPGTDVIVRLDPIDMGKVYVFSAADGRFLDTAICPELRDINRPAFVRAEKDVARQILADRERDAKAELRRIRKGPSGIERTLQLYREKADARARESANVVPLPKRETEHSTPAIAAALDAARPAEPPAQPKRAAELLAEMRQEMAAPAASAPMVTPLRRQETPQLRFRRAQDLMARVEAGEAISTEDAMWLGGYRSGPEYRALQALHEDFGG